MASEQETRAAGELADVLGVSVDRGLLDRALIHRSYAYENGGLPHNERLEFLGDAVLGIVVTETLYRAYPDISEGRLAKLRASVVNMRAIAGVAREIGPEGLGAYVRLGRGELTTGGRDKSSILADTTEAVIGAVYLSGGLDAAAAVVHRLFDPLMTAVATSTAGIDWKTALQELAAAQGMGAPTYEISSAGPDHAKTFTAHACVGDASFEQSQGRSKKEAEQGAAEAAWRALNRSAGLAEPRLVSSGQGDTRAAGSGAGA